ncbi:Bifunctional ligase/repressor BirA [Candidatus Providencia siddallii]|uniref:Bifunctional ligase/repressor BirA, partial n=1 Tax=Candidatus Providencia siddallii TaxID=1715285 RepID=A0A0M6W929_9GAMM|nr:Bifunctional ligase/repressor BirA [Candidatus Providencia siddallii]
MQTNELNLFNKKIIQKHNDKITIFVKKFVNSTNQYILEHISILKPGDTCLAEYQSEGRGRGGSRWFSPFENNIYLSMYWKLNKKKMINTGLSIAIGVAIAELLNKITNKKIKLKWPNDLYMNNKKLAGILIELKQNNDNLIHIVIGIGINVKMSKDNIKNKNFIIQDWISLKDETENIEKNEISINIIKTLIKSLILFEKEGLKPFVEKWFKLDIFLNQKIKLLVNSDINFGIERGINKHGALLIENSYGKIISYINGKIFLKEN